MNLVLSRFDSLSNLTWRLYNPYSGSQFTTPDRKNDHRQKIVQFYYPSVRLDKVKCMLTGFFGDGKSVIAAHILPHSSKAEVTQLAGIEHSELNDPRNCLLLAEEIEEAFDRLDISFISDLKPFNPEFVLKIWTPANLLPTKGHPGDARLLDIVSKANVKKNVLKFVKKIGDFEGHPLTLPRLPFTRLLAFQAYLALERAKSNKWVLNNEHLPDFGTPCNSPHQRQRMDNDTARLLKENISLED